MRRASDRALRRELLVLRASLERAELASAVVELRQSLSVGQLIKRGAPLLAAEGGLLLVTRYLGRFPRLAGFARAVLGLDSRERAARARGGLARAMRIAAAVAAGWRLWQVARTLRRGARSEPNGSAPLE